LGTCEEVVGIWGALGTSTVEVINGLVLGEGGKHGEGISKLFDVLRF